MRRCTKQLWESRRLDTSSVILVSLYVHLTSYIFGQSRDACKCSRPAALVSIGKYCRLIVHVSVCVYIYTSVRWRHLLRQAPCGPAYADLPAPRWGFLVDLYIMHGLATGLSNFCFDQISYVFPDTWTTALPIIEVEVCTTAR